MNVLDKTVFMIKNLFFHIQIYFTSMVRKNAISILKNWHFIKLIPWDLTKLILQSIINMITTCFCDKNDACNKLEGRRKKEKPNHLNLDFAKKFTL